MSRIGKLPITVPGGVKVTIAPGHVKVEGPKGQLERTLPAEITVKRRTASSSSSARERRLPKPLPARARAEPGRQHGRGRQHGLHEKPGAGRRRIPRRQGRATTSSSASATRTRSVHAAQGHHDRGPGPDAVLGQRHLDQGGVARSRRRSVASVRPSRTRARASCTAARRSAARPARPARAEDQERVK